VGDAFGGGNLPAGSGGEPGRGACPEGADGADGAAGDDDAAGADGELGAAGGAAGVLDDDARFAGDLDGGVRTPLAEGISPDPREAGARPSSWLTLSGLRYRPRVSTTPASGERFLRTFR
jgi:hypothetical protein